MYSTLKRAKWHMYAITLVVAVVILGRSGFRSLAIPDDFFVSYGVDGHIIILIVSFAIAFYLGFINAYGRWLYPYIVAGFVHFVFPFIVLMANPLPHYQHGFLYWILFGFVLVYVPHLVIPLLGLLLGKLIWKINIV